MRWPETSKLIDRIRRERPELTVSPYASGQDHYALRLSCAVKDQKEPNGRRLLKESLGTVCGPEGWKEYLRCHPAPFCRPEDSYHTNAVGQEVDHRGNPVLHEPPHAPRITAEDMLGRIIALNHARPDWWKDAGTIKQLADTWGVRVGSFGVVRDFEQEEVARLAGDCHASVLIARTGSGLFASGYTARWGDGGTSLEPTVGSVPYDNAFEARRAAFKELIATLDAGRGGQQRQLLLKAVKERDAQRDLFG